MNFPPTVNLDRTAFSLDIDGTLLDIVPTPDSVHVPERMIGWHNRYVDVQ